MSAFLSYTGAYEHNGQRYHWRCYATARVHGLRKREHGPNPPAPNGLGWVTLRRRHEADPDLSWLVDAGTADFSQMLIGVEAEAGPSERAERIEQHVPA